MKVWIASRGYDYEGDDIIGVYSNIQAAVASCMEDMGEADRYDIINKDGTFYASQGTKHYSVYPYDVEG